MNKSYTVLALFRAKPGKESELKKVLMGLLEPTRKEPGCLDYTLHCDLHDPASFMFYENFINKEAHDEHCKTPYFLAWRARQGELLATPIAATFWEKL